MSLTPPQCHCPPRDGLQDPVDWSTQVLDWGRCNLPIVRHALVWAKHLEMSPGETDLFLSALLIQALCDANTRAYLTELNRPLFVAAPKGPPWISVTDQLPEEGKSWVLCVDGSEGGGAMCTMAWWKQPDGSYRWTHLNTCEHPNLHPEDVTHWTPLPEAPKPKNVTVCQSPIWPKPADSI